MESDAEGVDPRSFANDHLDGARHATYRSRLYQLFAEIEKEFEALFAENLARASLLAVLRRLFAHYILCLVHAKVEALTERLADGGALPPEATAEMLAIAAADVGIKHTSKRGRLSRRHYPPLPQLVEQSRPF